jgi:hypothetical protein
MRPASRASLLLLVAAAACGSPDAPRTQDPETLGAAQPIEAEADLENGLAYDACTWTVTVGETGYAPTASSRALIEKHTTNIGHTRARIRYRVTGDTATVECGWGKTLSLPAIEILSLTLL